jgi:hypothetical protein
VVVASKVPSVHVVQSACVEPPVEPLKEPGEQEEGVEVAAREQ